MKKNNKLNKIIILSVIVLIFTISLVIFILNYTKDSSSFSILEKNWISNNASNVIDVSIYNDVPIYGQDGEVQYVGNYGKKSIFQKILDFFQ